MKKIGIITYYYKSINYGGNLQAYALCKKLNDLGGQAEQICFDAQKQGLKSYKLLHIIKSLLRKFKNYIFGDKKMNMLNRQIFEKRTKAFNNFNNILIPHSSIVYSQDTIKKCIDEYDVFVAGSDQIWNPNWYVPAYFLNFVTNNIKKVSYATSFGATEFSSNQKRCIKEHLKDFTLISLREHSVLEQENVFPFKPSILLDPTLLLSNEEWSNICEEIPIQEQYVFCYFFGDSVQNRILARKYAEENGCKIISIPHLNGYNKEDRSFADIEFIDASPEQFLSLIKNAECVFTDSFHAVVFSHIFNKEYFVFKRSNYDKMSSRIYSITKLFHSEGRFCHTIERMNLDYINSLEKIDYSIENSDLKDLQKKSYSFLYEILSILQEKK